MKFEDTKKKVQAILDEKKKRDILKKRSILHPVSSESVYNYLFNRKEKKPPKEKNPNYIPATETQIDKLEVGDYPRPPPRTSVASTVKTPRDQAHPRTSIASTIKSPQAPGHLRYKSGEYPSNPRFSNWKVVS